jgi:hypothetical protein
MTEAKKKQKENLISQATAVQISRKLVANISRVRAKFAV